MMINTHKVPVCSSCGSQLIFKEGAELICTNKFCKTHPKGKTRYSILIEKSQEVTRNKVET